MNSDPIHRQTDQQPRLISDDLSHNLTEAQRNLSNVLGQALAEVWRRKRQQTKENPPALP